jgi:5-methylcytosine-specific restriction endonuclease McrA
MKEYAEKFYKSKQWQIARETAIKRDRYLCVDCLRRDMVTPAEEVHHIIELTPENINDPSISLNLDNLVSLCRECHKARHGNRDPRRYKVDELGRVVIR